MPEITTDLAIENAIKQTMQALPDAKKDGAWAGSFWAEYSRTSYLAPRGTRKREHDLRALSRHDDNSTVMSALVGITKIWSSTQWEITGPETLDKGAFKYYQQRAKAIKAPNAANSARPDLLYFQSVFRNAEFDRGWTVLIEKLGIDFLRQDAGAFVEIIAPGDPTKPPTGPITGLAVLDSVRCWPTGDPDFPVVYWNRQNEYHLLHHTRIMQFQDMPETDELRPGYGVCALSRAVAISQREILMNRYISTQLDDLPPPGIVNASGMNESSRDKSVSLYRRDQNGADAKPEWGRLMWVFGPDPSVPIKLEIVQFSKPPEKFDWKVYTDLDIDLLALAIGVDRHDLMQLSGAGLGSKGQSETMAQKARGKTIGLLRTEMERKFNNLLPEEYEFKWKYKDTQEELERAQIATAWMSAVASVPGVMSPDEQRALLASQIEPFKDAISDENGKILSVGDGDVQTAQQIADDTAAANALTLATTPPPVDPNKPKPVGGGDSKPVPKRPGMGAKLGRDEHDSAEKAIQATRLDFEDAFAESVKAVQDGTMNRRRFGVVARALVAKYGRMAFNDGLEDGGVSADDISEDDTKTVNELTVAQSSYVTSFANALFGGVDYTPEARAEMWWNKSINPFYQAGVMSADKNGLYEWTVGDTEHCDDCRTMDGQIHRYRDYVKRQILPNSSNLACWGGSCECTLAKRSGKARGKWLSVVGVV